jgi:hypothetical protein
VVHMNDATTTPKRKYHKTFKDAREYCDKHGGVVLYVGPYDEEVCYRGRDQVSIVDKAKVQPQ